jgi:hypothetical protein
VCVSLLSNWFIASALVCFSNWLIYLALFFLTSLSSVCSFVGLHGFSGSFYTKVHSEYFGESWIGSTGGFQC